MNSTINIIKETSINNPNKVALVINDERITYKEFYNDIKAFSEYLTKEGIKKGDYVVVKAWCSKYYFISMYGIILAGGIFVPLERDYTASQIDALNKEFGGIFMLVSNDSDSSLEKLLNIHFLSHENFKNILKETIKEFDEPANDDVSFVIYTTGTTGKAKGVCLPYRYLYDTSFNIKELPYDSNSILLVSLPLNHIFAIGRSSLIFSHGATLVVTDGLNNFEQFYRYVKEEKVNAFVFTPSAINYLLALTKDELLSNIDQYKFFEIGGEKLLKSLQELYVNLFKGVRLFIGYASTESGPIGVYEFSKYGPTENRVGTVNEHIKFFDEKGGEVSANKEQPGFIGYDALWTMKYYLNAKEETEKVKHGSVVLMSDYGYKDEEGFLCLSGRAGDVIISGALKINPLEVENAAMGSGEFQECVCFGKKDEIFGQKVALYVVMKKGVPFNKVSIRKYLASKMEKFKVPKIIEEVDKIERNKVGKINRKYYKET